MIESKPLIARLVVGIIIPTCNRHSFLEKCLENLLRNPLSLDQASCRVVVTDDGEMQITRKMFQRQFPTIDFLQGPQRGPAANRNYAAKQFDSEWIVFLDDDCVPREAYLEAYQRRFKGRSVLEGKTTSMGLDLKDNRFEAPLNLSGGKLFSCNLAIRRELFLELGGFDERFEFWCEDLDLHQRIKKRGIPIEFVPDATVDHPPRLRPVGRKLGSRWVGMVDLWTSQGKTVTTFSLLTHVLKVRLGEIRRAPIYQYPSRLISFTSELVEVTKSAANWIQRAKSTFGSASPGLER